MKKIVVLVALYKAGEHLAGKLRNLKVQTYFDQAQIVLLNCQNLDGESSIYADFVRDNQNVYTIEYDYHVTLYDSWNDGLKRTQSEYVTNANVDDRWHPSYLEVMSKYLDDHQDVGVVSSNVLTTSIPNATFPWEPDGALPPCVYPASTAGPSPMWRRSLHDRHGLFDGRCRAIGDAIMWEKWHAAGEKFAHISQDLVLYLRNPESLERRSSNGMSFRDLDLRDIGR